jgi:hypothetical protein
MNFHYCLYLNHFILIDIYLYPIPNFILKIHHLLQSNDILDFTLIFSILFQHNLCLQFDLSKISKWAYNYLKFFIFNLYSLHFLLNFNNHLLILI